jgi:ABC-type transport system involved in cytochrome c biogenesis permease subunit
MAQYLATAALVLIAAAAALQIVFLMRKGEARDPVSHWALLAASLLLLAVTIDRSIKISFPAVTNTYESLVFFSAAICIVVFVLRLVMKASVTRFILFGGTIVALALLMISSSPIAPKDIQPPIPALQSLWLVLHVTLAFIGEAFFTVSFVAAIVYLATKDEARRVAADRIIYTTIGIGYPIFTVGALIFGAVWAETAWGRWWGWDPKETWALITWLVYTAYLHTRLIRRLRGRVAANLAIIGFVFTVFTFFGVNFLLSGLHSYG